MKMTFKKCNMCGQIVGIVNDTGVPLFCCGEEMETISPCIVEAELGEKHLPVYKREKNKLIVEVGKTPHPSTEQHYIEWIALVTTKGHQRKILKPKESPTVTFMLDDDEEPLEIYAYCNIHSLWVTIINKNKDCCK